MRIRTGISAISHLASAFAAAALLASCATVASLDGTSESLENSTETATDVSSSTSPGDDSASRNAKSLVFAQANLERLKTDMAVGGGEHLACLGRLIGVRDSRQQELFSLSRERFFSLVRSERTTAAELVANLDAELAKSPGLRN